MTMSKFEVPPGGVRNPSCQAVCGRHLPSRVIDEITSGHLRHIIVESDFIESSFNAIDWNSIITYEFFTEMVEYGELSMLFADLAPDER
jgi:hypothetical protein